MTSRDKSSEAIRMIYEAAVSKDHWDAALDASAAMIEAKSSVLLVADVEANLPYTLSVLSRDFRVWKPDVVTFYVEQYSHLETRGYEYVKARPNQIVFDDHVIWPEIETPQDRADYDFLHKQNGTFRRLIARLNDNNRWFDCITFQFADRHRDVPQASVASAQELVPHIAKAVELGRVNHKLHQLYGAVLGALDHVRFGMCVLLPNGEIIVTNSEAGRILDACDGLSRSRLNRLVSSHDIQTAEIASAASRLSATAAGVDRQVVHTLFIRRASGKPPIILEITPLRDSFAEIESELSAALVTMIDTGRCQDIRLDVFARVYDLTSSEVDVCRLLVDGLSDQQIAESRQVKLSTVKSQLKSIRMKSGTSSRVDLVRLALQTSPPIF